MIFATVGTHEDPFNRLLEALDRLKEQQIIQEDVRIQSGYSTYIPRFCQAEKMLAFDLVQAWMAEARIIITHGGPATIMQALSHGKIPIVVPRQPAFKEHVDGHQVAFARRLRDRVLVVEDIAELGPLLQNYEAHIARLPSPEPPRARAERFAERLDLLCQGLIKE